MRWSTVLLAWVVALLALGVWAVMELASRAERPEVMPLVAQPPSADEVERIEINRGRGEPLVFERTGLSWRQTKPIEVQVEPLAMRQLIDGAFGLVAEDCSPWVGDGHEGPFGLVDSAPQIVFATAGGEFQFRLGHRTSAGRAWVGRDDQPWYAYLTLATLHDLVLATDERQWRKTALFERADVDADRVSVEALDARTDKRINMEVVRDGAVWRMEQPIHTRADQEGVLRLLEALSRAQATGFVVDEPESLDAFGLENPVATIEVDSTRRSVKDGVVNSERRTEGVLVGTQVLSGSPDRFGMISGVNSVLELDGPTIASLLPDLSQLIDARASGVAVADVTGLRIERPNGEVVSLRRQGDGWMMGPDPTDPQAIDAQFASQLLERFCTAKADGFELGQAPGDLQMATVTLLGLDGAPAATLKLSHESGPAGKWAVDGGDGLLRIFDPAWGEPLERLLNN